MLKCFNCNESGNLGKLFTAIYNEAEFRTLELFDNFSKWEDLGFELRGNTVLTTKAALIDFVQIVINTFLMYTEEVFKEVAANEEC